jgi:hypothetical protein
MYMITNHNSFANNFVLYYNLDKCNKGNLSEMIAPNTFVHVVFFDHTHLLRNGRGVMATAFGFINLGNGNIRVIGGTFAGHSKKYGFTWSSSEDQVLVVDDARKCYAELLAVESVCGTSCGKRWSGTVKVNATNWNPDPTKYRGDVDLQRLCNDAMATA